MMGMMGFIFLIIYFILLGSIVFVGYFLQIKKEQKHRKAQSMGEDGMINLKELVVIIPFRNEENRIEVLLNSLSLLRELPQEFIFVDDHSRDKTIDVITQKIGKIPHRILQLPKGKEGKKQAIRYAIENSGSTYILSWDADVEIEASYFSNIYKLSPSDLYILPAIMKAKKWYEHLYEVDLILVNAANAGLAGLKRPIMASGANMLYQRASFEKFDQFERHAHIPSGDDIYLLRDFRDAGADVRLITNTAVAIHTETPQSLREFIHQRLRWIAKTGDVKDALSTSLAIIQVILTFSFVILMCTYAFKGEWKIFFVFFLLKTSIDMLLFLPYFNRIKRMKSWLFIPIYEILFPIYSLMILILMYSFKPIWKGRRLMTNY